MALRKRKNPWAALLFFLVWGGFLFTFAFCAVRDGHFQIGMGRGSGMEVTPATHPVLFWGLVSIAVIAGIVGIGLSVRGVVRHYREKSKTIE